MCAHRLRTLRAQRRQLSHFWCQNDDFRDTQMYFFGGAKSAPENCNIFFRGSTHVG